MIEYFLSLSTTGKIKMALTFIPILIISIILSFLAIIGEVADKINIEGSWLYGGWLEAEHKEGIEND